ncbi:acetate--CoA ligase family protein [Paralcaligenes sp. KSB-10]|uniref:acetate--CoA ligase family protein n=1 Tax=Paralcaligenes sp. KSB-10 TaxID=2901142 RepID=UPI001E3AFF3D|nr:acetate--CoA ligase family protein [Paralcaligenes sp. KSB-10]UHL65236.1 acetate--CoA ligase family protein [Paralcaligenes sp. KSB-10]
MEAINRLWKPRSIAVIGASSDVTKTSGKPLAYLKKHDFKGQIYPVNPSAREIAGLPCYPDIASLPEAPDVAIVMLSAEKAIPAVRALAAIGTATAIVLASGYAELGEEGARRQEELKKAAGSMRLLGPNTIGLVNLTDNIPLSASGALEVDSLPKGNIALVSQSGGILGSLLSRAATQGIGFSKLVSTSNEADLDLADFTDALIDDEATTVIALYMESLRNPDKFRKIAKRARSAGKPIVVFKVGRSESGARSAVSHTGAMAGSDRMYDALFKEAGVIRVQEFADLLSVPLGLSIGRPLKGNRIAILTSTGGAGTLVADSLGLAGFDTPVPDEATAEKLRSIQNGQQAALDRNPIDVTLAGLDPKLLRGAISTLMLSDSYDAIVAIVGSSALAMPTLVSSAIEDCLSLNGKPVFTYISPHAPHIAAQLNRLGIPAFTAPETCASVFKAMLAASQAAPEYEPTPSTTRQQENIPSGPLNETQSKQLFARFGIPVTREITVANPQEAEHAAKIFAGPVALKMLSDQLTHKSDVGGVMLNLRADTIAEGLLKMQDTVRDKTGDTPQSFLVQEMAGNGEELILGLARDPLGCAILLGTGGTAAELFNDTVLVMQPPDRALTRVEADSMIRTLKSWPLLNGYRGKPLRDTEALVSAIVGFSEMVHCLGPRLLEAEINPIFVKDQGHGVLAADGVVVLAKGT